MAFRRYDGVMKKTKHETRSVDADLAEAMIPPIVQRSSGADCYWKKLVADQVDDIPDSEVNSEVKAHIFPSSFNLA